jgi:hypothetical protein
MNEPWLWLKSTTPGVLTLLPVDEEGTISVTNNSTSATLSSTRAVDLEGYFLQVDGHGDVFRISAHTAGSDALTLDSVYTGETDGDATFRLMKLEYELAADVLRPIAPFRAYSDGVDEVEGIDLSVLDKDYPLRDMETGTPDRFALVTETKVRFNRAGGTTSTDLRRLDYDYLRVPDDLADDSTEPLVPKQHRQVLSDTALFYLLTSKSDDKAAVIGLQVKAGLLAMQSDNRKRLAQMSRSVGRLYLRPTHQAQRLRVMTVG